MKANYTDTNHSRIKCDIYNATAELFFSAITFFLADKQGWNSKRIYQALEYIQKLLNDIYIGEVDSDDIRDDLKNNYGIVIEKNIKGIKIKLDESEEQK